MLSKVYRFFEYAYLIIAVFFTYEAINNWEANRERAYLFLFFCGCCYLYVFFQKKFQKENGRTFQKINLTL